jgi:glycosyltransferase involved in cell wall biosynthesis
MPERAVLRIGVDARELLGAPTGAGRYAGELLSRWVRRADASRRLLLLYVPGGATGRIEGLARAAGPGGCAIREVPGSGRTWWEQFTLPRAVHRDSVDVFFAPAYMAPLALRAPVVVAIHDVSYLAHPEWFGWRHGLRRRWLTRGTARRAARVLTISEFSRSEILAHLDVRADRLEVIPCGIARPEPSDAAGPVPREPVVLFAGSIFNRRHVPDLVRAFASVAARHPDVRLVIAGENRTTPHQDPSAVADQMRVGRQVTVLSYVTDAELADLYRRARVFAFLSEYEGLGMTPLEALAAGVPPVLYDTAVAREACGEAAAFVTPGDVAGVAAALERLLFDAAAREQIMARAPAVLARYSWDRTADLTLVAIERLGRAEGARP